MSDPLYDAIAELVPIPAAHGDWNAVLERAGAERAARAPVSPRRRAFVGLGIAAVAIALLATPAGSTLLDLIGRTDVVFSHTASAPNVVKKQFADMGIGAPAGMATQAIAGDTREVGVFTIRGNKRALWVAPTRRGGYCYIYERAFGGCRETAAERTRFPLGITWTSRSLPGTQREVIAGGGGEVSSAAVEHVELIYANGDKTEIPFVWVSKPIAAGFFTFTIPVGRALTRVIGLDANGKQIAATAPPPIRRPIHFIQPTPSPPAVLPSAPPVAPSAPLQQGEGDGVSVIAGRNGAVVFDLSSAMTRLAGAGHRLGYSCFRVTHEFGIFGTQGGGREGALSAKVAFDLSGIRGPFDACDVSGLYGHTWPDRFDSHSPAEIPLTDAGRRFFADRAAARDLAAFIRLRRVQQLRKEPGAQALRDLETAYPQLARSSIHVTPTATGLTFSETSATGKTFRVVVSNKRIVHQNVRPYAFVF